MWARPSHIWYTRPVLPIWKWKSGWVHQLGCLHQILWGGFWPVILVPSTHWNKPAKNGEMKNHAQPESERYSRKESRRLVLISFFKAGWISIISVFLQYVRNLTPVSLRPTFLQSHYFVCNVSRLNADKRLEIRQQIRCSNNSVRMCWWKRRTTRIVWSSLTRGSFDCLQTYPSFYLQKSIRVATFVFRRLTQFVVGIPTDVRLAMKLYSDNDSITNRSLSWLRQ